MANNPIDGYNLPADMPINWSAGQLVSPNGTEVSLSTQHGYNYLMRTLNTVQNAIKAIGAAFPNLLDNSTPIMGYGVCSTSGNVRAKTVTVTGNLIGDTGESVRVIFTNKNGASSPTLNVNNLGALPIQTVQGTAVDSDTSWNAGEAVDFVFNGLAWVMVSGGVLPIGRGGTAANTASGGVYNLINQLTTYPYTILPDTAMLGTTQGTTGYKISFANLFASISSKMGSYATVETGSYVGTGVVQTMSLTFTKQPKFVVVFPASAPSGAAEYQYAAGFSSVFSNHLVWMPGITLYNTGFVENNSTLGVLWRQMVTLTYTPSTKQLNWDQYQPATSPDNVSRLMNISGVTYAWVAVCGKE